MCVFRSAGDPQTKLMTPKHHKPLLIVLSQVAHAQETRNDQELNEKRPELVAIGAEYHFRGCLKPRKRKF